VSRIILTWRSLPNGKKDRLPKRKKEKKGRETDLLAKYSAGRRQFTEILGGAIINSGPEKRETNHHKKPGEHDYETGGFEEHRGGENV